MYNCPSNGSNKKNELTNLNKNYEEFEVKTCYVKTCGYAEKRTSNNMKHYYLIYHRNMEYPIHHFDIKIMGSYEFEKLKICRKESSEKNLLRDGITDLEACSHSKRMRLE